MKNFPAQIEFLEKIKSKISDHQSLPHEIAELLSISNDSAYRRLRGETALTFEEARILSLQFGIPLQEMKSGMGEILFLFQSVSQDSNPLKTYLLTLLQQLRHIESAEKKEIVYFAKDIPLFHFFHLPEIARFKFYFWMRFVFRFHGMEKMDFETMRPNSEAIELSQAMLRIYCKIPSREIWHEDTINSTLRQILFCWEAGFFTKIETVEGLLISLEELLNHLSLQFESSKKFLMNEPVNDSGGSFQVFLNEILLGDNSICVTRENETTLFIPHNTLNYLICQNPAFSEASLKHMETLMRSSVQVSGMAEKERTRLFKIMKEKINQARSSI